MKKLNRLVSLVVLSVASVAQAQRGTLIFPHAPLPAPLPPVPTVWVDTNFQPPAWSAMNSASRPVGEVAVYEHKETGGHTPLVTPQEAREIVGRFKAAYKKMGSPRLLLFVSDAPVAGLANRPGTQEVERRFRHPWHQAGANLVDQKNAAQLLAGKSTTEFITATDTPQARQDRETLGKQADVVIEISLVEILPASLPEIQTIAIRLSDSKILGQAASSEVTKRVPPAVLAAQSTPELIEATALALMEDLTTNP